MQLHIRHETRYRYERPVKYSVQSLHLTPRRDVGPARACLDHHGARVGGSSRSTPTATSRTCSPSRSRTARSRSWCTAWSRPRTPKAARTTGRCRRSPISRRPRSPRRARRSSASRARPWSSRRIRAPARRRWPRRCARGALQARRERRTGHRRRGVQERRRGVPGSCACVHRLGALRGHAGALRERLSVHRRLQRRGEPCLGRCVARRRARLAEHGRDAPAARRSAPIAASRSAATISTPRRCAACVRAAAARRWKRTCWWRSRPNSSSSEVEFGRMTYCVGLLVDTGLVMLSDSRTNAGVDQINTFRKMATFQRHERPGAGAACRRAISPSPRPWSTCCTRPPTTASARPRSYRATNMFNAARVVGEALREIHERDAGALEGSRPRIQRHLHLGRPDQGRGAAAVSHLLGRQFHRILARHAVFSDRRVEVRQAHHRPGDLPQLQHSRKPPNARWCRWTRPSARISRWGRRSDLAIIRRDELRLATHISIDFEHRVLQDDPRPLGVRAAGSFQPAAEPGLVAEAGA